VRQWKPLGWYDEGGVIRRAIEPLLSRMMRESKTYVAIDYLTSAADKIARVASFRGRASAGTVHLPRNKPWAIRLLEQLLVFPMGRYDDAVDVCGNIGRALDEIIDGAGPKKPDKPKTEPFTDDWFAARERRDAHDEATRANYYR
jgi:hypothetical protein